VYNIILWRLLEYANMTINYLTMDQFFHLLKSVTERFNTTAIECAFFKSFIA